MSSKILINRTDTSELTLNGDFETGTGFYWSGKIEMEFVSSGKMPADKHELRILILTELHKMSIREIELDVK